MAKRWNLPSCPSKREWIKKEEEKKNVMESHEILFNRKVLSPKRDISTTTPPLDTQGSSDLRAGARGGLLRHSVFQA